VIWYVPQKGLGTTGEVLGQPRLPTGTHWMLGVVIEMTQKSINGFTAMLMGRWSLPSVEVSDCFDQPQGMCPGTDFLQLNILIEIQQNDNLVPISLPLPDFCPKVIEDLLVADTPTILTVTTQGL